MTTLSGSALTSALTALGARTSGNTRRKQERLQRFIQAKKRTANAERSLRVVIKNEQRKVYERSQQRADEILAAEGLIRLRMNTHLFFE